MYYLRKRCRPIPPRNSASGWGSPSPCSVRVAAFGIGNAVQVNSMAAALGNSFSVPTWVTGIVRGGTGGHRHHRRYSADRRGGGQARAGDGRGSMSGAALVIIAINIVDVPAAFGLIFTHAFTPAARNRRFRGGGGRCRHPVRRSPGACSPTRSGLGSAAIAHAAAQTNSPVRQGIIAMLGTFIDTLVVCTMTALVILTSGAWTMTGADGGGLNRCRAYVHGLREHDHRRPLHRLPSPSRCSRSPPFLGWSYYGERCWQYLFHEKSLWIYRGLWVLAALAFANVKVDLVWNLSDTLNGLMAIPNLVGLLLLAPMVFKVTREYFDSQEPGR